MSFRDKVKDNIPKVALDSIFSLIAGSYKSGKTRLWKEVTELHYKNPEEALLIAFEKGYETWQLSNMVPIHEEGSGSEEWKVWDYFKKELVPGLTQEAKTNKIVKLIGIDTGDRYISACEAWILHTVGKRLGVVFNDIGEIGSQTNGKENGWTLLANELRKPLDQLTNAGYGIMVLAWTKEKDTTLFDGRKYNSVELMMHNTGKKVFESQASLICCLYNEVKIMDKEGTILNENKKDKKGKDVASKFHETEVMMYFRPTQYISIAGGRYTNLPEKMPYSAENFLNVFEEAVKGQFKENVDIKELEKQEKIPVEKIETQDSELPEPSQTIEETISEIIEKIKVVALEKKANKIKGINPILGKMKYKTIEEAQDVLDRLKALQ